MSAPSYKELQAHAAALGIPAIGVKKVELEAAIAARLADDPAAADALTSSPDGATPADVTVTPSEPATDLLPVTRRDSTGEWRCKTRPDRDSMESKERRCSHCGAALNGDDTITCLGGEG